MLPFAFRVLGNKQIAQMATILLSLEKGEDESHTCSRVRKG
jgi:hypothetical protein